MALKGSIENEYGTTFDYHKISDVHIVIRDNDKQLRITVDSYVNKEARIQGKTPVRTCNIITNADFAMTAFYALLKAKFDDFGSIEDDFDDTWKTDAADTEQWFVQQTPQGKLISKKIEQMQTEETAADEDAAEETTTESEEE